MSLIEWRHDGRRLVLPVALLRPSTGSLDMHHERGTALLDTGATNSGITPRMVGALGLVGQGKRPLNSAHGPKQTERYIFRIGFFADPGAGGSPLPYVFDDVNGFALEDSFDFEALIGMDILSQCDLKIDRRRNCTLGFGFA